MAFLRSRYRIAFCIDDTVRHPVVGIDATWMVRGQVEVDDPTLDLMQQHPLDLTKSRAREAALQGELAAAGWSRR
jgi:hypothetical protein